MMSYEDHEVPARRGNIQTPEGICMLGHAMHQAQLFLCLLLVRLPRGPFHDLPP